MRSCWALERRSISFRVFSQGRKTLSEGGIGGMAETMRRGATTDPGSGPRGHLPDTAPNHLPFARAASVIAVVLLAGALFGYDQGVISGALLGIQKAFEVGHVALEIVTSWVTLGAMFGSLAGGYFADLFGRRRTLLAAAALFI